MHKSTFKKIEQYLYYYNTIDIQLELLKIDKYNNLYNQNYKKYITHKSSSLENQVIENINLENRILKISKWKELITYILKKYKQDDKLKFNFIVLKYLKKCSKLEIKKQLNLSFKEQENIQAEILQYIFFVAIKHGILKEVYD